MPTIPSKAPGENYNSANILKAIWNNASAEFQAGVPRPVEKDINNLRAIGKAIMDYKPFRNEFLTSLLNRIGMVVLTSKIFKDPWAVFNKGFLEFGESVEEIFVEISKPFKYDPAKAEQTIFKRNIPDVRTAFHILNYQYFYKQTISDKQMRQAFLSFDGVDRMIAGIVNSMYTSMHMDTLLTHKYMLARNILNGNLPVVSIPAVSAANMKTIVTSLKSTSNLLEVNPTIKYNIAKVHTFTLKEDQWLIMTAPFDAANDVEVLASAFNMDRAAFMGHRLLVDSFGEMELDRLDALFSGEDWYEPLTTAELELLKSVPAVLVDKDFFQVYEVLLEFTEVYNTDGLWWNYDLHTWRIFSVSPFSNAVVFAPGTPGITSLTVSPAAATVYPGQIIQLSAIVTTDWFDSQAVTWEVTSGTAEVDPFGKVTIPSTAAKGDVITVKATSVADTTKSATSTLTVG